VQLTLAVVTRPTAHVARTRVRLMATSSPSRNPLPDFMDANASRSYTGNEGSGWHVIRGKWTKPVAYRKPHKWYLNAVSRRIVRYEGEKRK